VDKQDLKDEISGSEDDEYKDDCLLECCGGKIALTMEAVNNSETCFSFYHGETSQRAVIFKNLKAF
jgi:xanthine/CO dehydrogenase XdhC/CoxF family maturation factor